MSSGFTKFFATIVSSTIWREDDKTRIVWVTMLALADKCGVVEASIPGLADLSRVSVSDCQQALDKLGSPDPFSRSKAEDGRRILPVDGGWRLVNHGYYRAKLAPDQRREYLRVKQAEYRQREKQTALSTVSTQAEADPEAEAEPPLLTYPTDGIPANWHLTQSQVNTWRDLYSSLDIMAECRKALAWVLATPEHRKTARGMSKFLVNWLNRATNAPRMGTNAPKRGNAMPSHRAHEWRWLCRHNPQCDSVQEHAERTRAK